MSAQSQATHAVVLVSGGMDSAVTLALARIDDLPQALEVHARRLLGGDGHWQYQFRIEHAHAPIASGRAAVITSPAPGPG